MELWNVYYDGSAFLKGFVQKCTKFSRVDIKLCIPERLQHRQLQFAASGRAMVTDSPTQGKLQLPEQMNFWRIKIPIYTGAMTLT